MHAVYANEKKPYYILYWSLYYINSLHHTHWVKHQCNRVSKRDNWYSPTRFSFPLPTDRFANMTRSRVWQKSLFSSNSNSGCDNVFGDDPKPMHQSCWLVDKKAFSVLHVSHFEFYVLFFSPLMSVEVWFMFCLFEGIALCVNTPVLDVWKWVIQHVMLEKCDGVLPDFRICLASLSYIIMYSKDRLDSIRYRINTCVHIVPSYS